MKYLFMFLLIGLISCNDSSEIIESIINQNKTYEKFYNSGDVEDLLMLHAQDAVIMPPNVDFIVGREAIAKSLTDEIGSGASDIKFVDRDIRFFGNLAFNEGTYSLNIKSNDKIIDNDYGKYLVIWEKQNDGKWLMLKDIWNSNKPKNELKGFSSDNFQAQKKFVEEFQKGWNNMDVVKLGNLNTVDTVIINYTTNDVLKVNFKDESFWNSFFNEYKSLSWNFNSVSPISDQSNGVVVKSYSINEKKNGELSNEKWVMFFYFNAENQLVQIDEYMK